VGLLSMSASLEVFATLALIGGSHLSVPCQFGINPESVHIAWFYAIRT
jgi:hypothetical protein